MPRITTVYVVQTFVETDGGLAVEESFQCRTAEQAVFRADAIAPFVAGVLAWAKVLDHERGEWGEDDPVILFKAGKTGDKPARHL
jgi:hypothetical protein